MTQFINRSTLGLITGLGVFLLVLIQPIPDGLSPEGQKVAAIAALMAIFWVSEAIPIPATALLPIVLYPLLGVMNSGAITPAYANHLIYLFMGGFMIAVTMERWNLHRRLALHTIRLVGVTPRRIILGFMLATAFLSMWISNTAATMLMTTIALAVLSEMTAPRDNNLPHKRGSQKFGVTLMLGIAYSASIGGIATLIGSPPNAIFAGIIEKQYGVAVGFLEWMGFALPLSLVMLFFAWFYLTFVVFRGNDQPLSGGQQAVHQQIERLGTMSTAEKRVLVIFILVASAWILRGLFRPDALKMVQDSTIAIGGVLLLFITPSGEKPRQALLDWQTAVKIPWDIIVLFGGGFALASGFADTGLTQWTGNQLLGLSGIGPLIVTATVVLLVIFLTEITSNTATASLVIPIMGSVAIALDMSPFGLMIAITIAASCAFMLPVATPPNAIVFGSRHVTIQQMAKTGFWLNLIAAVSITGFVWYFLPAAWR